MTNASHSTPSIITKIRNLLISPLNPPKRVTKERKVKAKPIETLDEFEIVHQQASDKLDRYSESKRPDYAKFMSWVSRDMQRNRARYFNAVNLHARTRLADLLLQHVHDEPAMEIGPLYFVTVVSSEFVVSVRDAAAMSCEEVHCLVYRLQQLTRQALQGVPFIGMIEVGVYKGWGPNGPNPYMTCISWHAHALVWGVGESRMKEACKRLGPRHKSISGGKALHWKTIAFDELDVHTLYLAKVPLKEYRLNEKVGDKYDAETGEVFVKYRQQKRDIRRREQVQALNALRHLNLDDLLFAGGAGRRIAKSIKDIALAPVRREEERNEAVRERHRRLIAASSA